MFVSSAIVALAAALTAVSAGPVQLEERANPPLTQCYQYDSQLYIPSNSQCQNAYTETAYTFGTETVPFGQQYINVTSKNEAGPQHCCFRCQQDATCVGWQFNDDCSCQFFKSTIGCPTVAGTFGHSASTQQNATGSYHVNVNFCPVPSQV